MNRLFRSFAFSQGLKTPDFLIESLSTFSHHEEFQRFAREKYRLVIVDEFQDTDPAQWDILNRIFASDTSWKGSFVLVGDPKQSIYSFRKADMYSYMAAKSFFATREQSSLSTNFRATSTMVEAMNRLFSSKENPYLFFLPKENAPLLVEEIASFHGEPSEALPPIVMKIFHARGRGRTPTGKEEEAELYPWLLSVLAQEKKRNTPFENIAILVKDRYQAERIRQLLQKHQIEALLKRGERVIDTKAFHWLQAALQVVLSPKKKQTYVDMLLTVPTKETLEVAHQLQHS